jgi:hypothetical protein
MLNLYILKSVLTIGVFPLLKLCASVMRELKVAGLTASASNSNACIVKES